MRVNVPSSHAYALALNASLLDQLTLVTARKLLLLILLQLRFRFEDQPFGFTTKDLAFHEFGETTQWLAGAG